MISTGDVKKGVIIELDGQLMKVLDWSHIKMARGSAQVRMKLQNVRKGDIVERTFQAGTRWPRARVEQRKAQYLYADGDAFHFMDTETYDQFAISGAMLGDDARYLYENTDVFVSTHEGEVLGVDLPVTVDLVVTQTDPGFAGDTATGAKKAATLRDRAVVQVPLFVNEGDVLRIDTRTGEYVTRVLVGSSMAPESAEQPSLWDDRGPPMRSRVRGGPAHPARHRPQPPRPRRSSTPIRPSPTSGSRARSASPRSRRPATASSPSRTRTARSARRSSARSSPAPSCGRGTA